MRALHLAVWSFVVCTSGCAPGEEAQVVPPAGPDAGARDARTGDALDVSPDVGRDVARGDGGCVGASDCAPGTLCVAGRCVVDRGPCASSDTCAGDTRCEPSLRRCVPYGDGEHDARCERTLRPGVFTPSVQCAFDAAPAGDRLPEHLHVLSTPMVADFHIRRGPDDPQRPSIVAVFDDGVDGDSELPTGLIRILDGRTCAQQYVLDGQMVSHSSPVALGDLDGDGRAEIVAFRAGGGLVAFRYDASADRWAVMWRSTYADGVTPFDVRGGGWSGPSIADLDDDGRPEVFRHGLAFQGQTGAYVGGGAQQSQLRDYSQGEFSVVVDVDADGRPELVTAAGVSAWDATRRDWVPEAYYHRAGCTGGGCGEGHVAVADLGRYATSLGVDAVPEIAVVASGFVRIDTLDGRTVFGPVALPGGGTGGAPTVADFDGDGVPEVAAAGAMAYSVFDPDCGMSMAARPTGRCGTGTTTGVLWSRPSQDASSNVTGSTSFDFEGDGRVEAVYADECFARVYDGATGDVLFSQHHSSCTWYENPVVADVDGDFRAEIVVGSNFNCGDRSNGVACPGVGPRGVDTLFAGVHCAADGDCLSGRCAAGLCRCTTDEQCCPPGASDACTYVCAAPPAGAAGEGNTCRAARPRGVRGLRVYQDVADRWVRSRMVWNQHPYHVTNVTDALAIPRASAVRANWRDPALNNFRTNVQGTAAPAAAADATAGGGRVECGPTGAARLVARACNRGEAPLPDGLVVAFRVSGVEAPACRATTTRSLAAGQCVEVSCAWEAPTPGAAVTVTADDARATTECREENNLATFTTGDCRSPG